MPQPRLVFRADGNAQIGLGHVMRCLALADMLGDVYERHIAIVEPDAALTTLLTDKNIPVIRLLTNEVTELLEVVRPGDVVVLDGYSFDEAYQRTLRRGIKTLVFIDDFYRGYQVADVVINHTGGITEYDYQAEAYTQFFLGPRYALLRPAFFGRFGPTPAEGPIFISLGGADPHNASLRVLENLHVARQLLGRPIPGRLVLGLFHPNLTAIEAAAQTMGDVTILSNLTAEQMADGLRQCRLAVTACSTVAYEVCAAGRPLIAIQTAANQDGLAEFFTRYTLANGVLQTSKLDSQLPVAIADALNNSDAPSTSFRRQFFDKQTPDRFRHIFARLCSPTA